MHSRRGAVLVICALLCLCSCSKEVETDPYDGYSLPAAQQQGGSPLPEANAFSLDIAAGGEVTTLSLHFKTGSRMSGTEAEAEAAHLPPYTLWQTGNPSRLMLQVEELAYWDYERRDIHPQGFVKGVFRYEQPPAESVEAGEQTEDEPYSVLCFQLQGAAALQTQEEGGELIIRIIPYAPEDAGAEGEETGAWYLTGNALRDYSDGTLAGPEGLTPTFAADLTHVLLISSPYSSQIEADLARRQLLENNPDAVPAEWSTVYLEAGELPAFDPASQYQAAYEEAVLRRSGRAGTAVVYLANGLYLCPAPRRIGGGALYSKRITQGMGDMAYSYEQLYLRSSQGTDKPLLDYEFTAVEQAVFSPDGRRLAVLERAAERTNLYIIDVDAREVTAELSRAGFGDTVSALCWDGMGSTLFAISGSGEMQVNAYDFNVPDETKRHTIVDRDGANEGYIGYCGGEVYFSQSEMEGDMIYRIKPEGGVRKEFRPGSAFALSPNNAYMAISDASGVTGSGPNGLVLLNMATGEVEAVPVDFPVYEFLWDQEGTKLYYFENRLSGGLGEEAGEDTENGPDTPADPYPYTLWAYDLTTKASRAICDLPSTQVFASEEAERLLFNYTDEETMGEKIRATYWIDTDAGTA